MHVDPAGSSGADLSAVTGLTPTTEMSPPPSTYLNGTLDQISSSLSLSSDALRNALRTGSSLGQVAQQQGVSRSDMLKTLETAMQERRNERGVAPIDATALARIAERAIDRTRGGSAESAPSTSTAAEAGQADTTTNGVDIWA